MSEVDERKGITYRRELLRGPFHGIVDAAWQSLVVLMAIRVFEASAGTKALIQGANMFGLLLSPLFLQLLLQTGIRPARALMWIMVAVGAILAGVSLGSTLFVYTAGVVVAQMLWSQQGTMLAGIYSQNYPRSERGKRLSSTLLLSNLSAILFSLVAGRLLDIDLGLHVIVLAIMAAAAFANAACVAGVPSEPVSNKTSGSLLQNFSIIREDRLFAWLLGSWMLLGLGNLITLPVRVEYMANSTYGIEAGNTTIALVLVVTPSIANVLSLRMWGALFDRLNLITVRNLLNSCFVIGMLLFFLNRHIVLLGLGMAFIGLAMSGGRILWTLWVTRIAPPEKTSAYMSLHMACTGLRGSLAPFIGYAILVRSSPQTVALCGVALILAASVLFARVRNDPRVA